MRKTPKPLDGIDVMFAVLVALWIAEVHGATCKTVLIAFHVLWAWHILGAWLKARSERRVRDIIKKLIRGEKGERP